jgi:hypothetical protein
VRALALVVLLLLTGCVTEQFSVVGRDPTPAESIWIARCGSCHRRVRPATQTAEHIEKEMAKHERQRRVRLKPAEWAAITAFLQGPMPEGLVTTVK